MPPWQDLLAAARAMQAGILTAVDKCRDLDIGLGAETEAEVGGTNRGDIFDAFGLQTMAYVANNRGRFQLVAKTNPAGMNGCGY